MTDEACISRILVYQSQRSALDFQKVSSTVAPACSALVSSQCRVGWWVGWWVGGWAWEGWNEATGEQSVGHECVDHECVGHECVGHEGVHHEGVEHEDVKDTPVHTY